MSGDDVRHIDWNVTAKMGKPFVKVFREERELSVVTVAMLGGSLYFGQEILKVEMVAQAVALIGYSALANNDLFTHYNFTETMTDEVRGSKKKFAVAMSVEKIMAVDLIGHSANYTQMVSTLMKRLRRKSLIVILGDFFDIPSLRVLAKKHEVVAIVVRDRLEEKPIPLGYSALIDPQSGMILEGDFGEQSVLKYQQRIREHDIRLFESLRRDGIRSVKLYTHEKAHVALRRLFEGRA
jgi:uncharacterized protein (DUF58 family)